MKLPVEFKNGDALLIQERMKRILKSLGSPQKTIKAIHVAGTKGKGSTVAYIDNILRASGYTTGAYTSPHVRSLYERILVQGESIDSKEFDELVDRYKDGIVGCAVELEQQGERVSHFELLTALAFKHFEQKGVDMALIETGLGGARDATNVFDPQNVLACVITPIGMDHAEALGGTIEEIARAKAGILKQGTPVVIAKQNSPLVEAVLRYESSNMKAPSIQVPHVVTSDVVHPFLRCDIAQGVPPSIFQNVLFSIFHNQPDVSTGEGVQDAVELEVDLPMLGQHQADNAATSITATMALKDAVGFDKINLDSIKRGLENTKVRGRFETIDEELLEDGSSILTIVDGAHTKDSARCLADTIQTIFPDSPIALIISMASDKPHEDFCAEIQKIGPSVVVFTDVLIAGQSHRSTAPGVLTAAWQTAKMKNKSRLRCRELIQASMSTSIFKARNELLAHPALKQAPGIILVSGSLHAVAAAMEAKETKE